MSRSADGPTMEIDATTFAELEVFASSDGTGGVFDLLDRTTTSVGRSALRRRFERPMRRVDAIRRTQDAVRFFARHPGLVVLDDRAIGAVEAYLRSNIQLAEPRGWRSALEEVWVGIRYRGLVRELGAGARETAALFGRVARLVRALREAGAPEAVEEIAAELDRVAEEVAHARGGGGGTLGVDRALRGQSGERILRALELLGELDALSSMAVAGGADGWSIPEVVEADAFFLDAEGVHHPFLSDPTPNPARLSGGEPVVFLTGPNMAGKTTYLRSVALVVLLAQVGMAVPARRARLTPVEALFASLNPSDDLKAGLSYFLAEVVRVREAAALLARGRRALVLFDEVFRGTNVKDALEASAEVILGFARARDSGFVFSSHLAELVETLEAEPGIRFLHFGGEIVDGTPRYDFTLREGVSDKRFGLHLLRRAGVAELIARIGA